MKKLIRVAIAEDLKILRDGFERIIKSTKNMELVKAVATGEEIVTVTLENSIDVVLLDIEMETQNAGIDAAKKILKIKPFVKIIFLTVHSEADYITEALGLGATDYVIKSDDGDNIIHKIENAYYDKVELEMTVQKTLCSDYVKIKKNEFEVIELIKIITELTKSEKEVMARLLEGKTIKEISRERVVEIPTIKKQVGHLLKKFDESRTKEVVEKIKLLELEKLFN